MKLALVFVFCLFVFSHWGNASPVKYDNEEGEDTGVVANLLKLFDEVPVLKSTIEKSGLSFDEIKLLFGEQNLIGQLVNNIYKLSPVAGEIIDDAAKTNVEIRVVLAIARGKTPNLFDIFKLATSKQENMWTSIDNAASQNEHAQYILQKMKEPNPDIPNIWNMLTGKHLETDGIVDNDKYAIASSTKKKNRHLYEMSKFIEANWRPLEKAFHVLANLPINFVKVLQYILGLDYSAFRFAIAPSTMMNGKKYMITDNKSKYTVVGQGQSTFDPDDDADIVNILNEIRVTYPAMHDTFVRTNGNTAARTAVLHLVTETIEILNRLIG
ncbi:uncharacterized protein [Haliotis cracherodii]|uniref:uncharacterized protein n=1 Tax=Haliotis cracherodii TaxID=6455 RepID=UPI0039E99E97